MDWKLFGYKEYPFSVNPITDHTIELFTGHDAEITVCQHVLQDKNVRLIIEGARGVGTTSFANYLKFFAQKKHLYFSPRDEISVEKQWNLESLLTAVISTIVRELETSHGKEVRKNRIFTEAKALAYRLSEAYNNFGITAFAVGATYNKSSTITQPTFLPSTTLGYHLADLAKLAVKLGYKKGILIQLNNLDVNVIHSEEHLEYLFNAARDYFQINNISWLLVGDVGLRSFVARRIDRLDDIISHDIFVKPLSKKLYNELINKRLTYYKINKKAVFPLNREIFDYIYDITDGRLRYIFGLVYSLINKLYVGKLVQEISTTLAKETITALTQARMQKFNLSDAEITIIKSLVVLQKSTVTNLVKATKKNRTYVSRVINKLFENKLVTVKASGNKRIYSPSLDAKIAFSD